MRRLAIVLAAILLLTAACGSGNSSQLIKQASPSTGPTLETATAAPSVMALGRDDPRFKRYVDAALEGLNAFGRTAQRVVTLESSPAPLSPSWRMQFRDAVTQFRAVVIGLNALDPPPCLAESHGLLARGLRLARESADVLLDGAALLDSGAITGATQATTHATDLLKQSTDLIAQANEAVKRADCGTAKQ